MGKSREAEIAFWRDEFAQLDEETNQERQFDATFVGPPKPPPMPRRRSMFELANDWIVAQDEKMRSEVRATVLRELKDEASERARQRSYRRRLAEYADHKRALQLAGTMQEQHRVEAAGKIADIFELEGTHYEVRTVDRWLSQPDWTPPIDLNAP